eukprot:5410716-Alexandrium_andersonii.AAC.1
MCIRDSSCGHQASCRSPCDRSASGADHQVQSVAYGAVWNCFFGHSGAPHEAAFRQDQRGHLRRHILCCASRHGLPCVGQGLPRPTPCCAPPESLAPEGDVVEVR